MQAKVCFPKQYSTSAQPFIYRTDNTIDEVKVRVAHDLAHVHDVLSRTGEYLGSKFNVTDLSDVTLLDVQVDIHVPQPEVYGMHGYRELHLKGIVEAWAQRCRVTGVRGARFYAIEDPLDDGDNGRAYCSNSFTLIDPLTLNELDTSDENADLIMRTKLLIGTTVFYNDRFVTLGYPGSSDQVAASLENLFHYVSEAEPEVGISVVVNMPAGRDEYRYGV